MASSRHTVQHDLIDNRERKLADSIQPLLGEVESMRIHIGTEALVA